MKRDRGWWAGLVGLVFVVKALRLEKAVFN